MISSMLQRLLTLPRTLELDLSTARSASSKLDQILSQLMMLRLVDLIMSSLLQRLLTLPRTLETFSGIIIERQEVRTLLNLEILGRLNPLK